MDDQCSGLVGSGLRQPARVSVACPPFLVALRHGGRVEEIRGVDEGVRVVSNGGGAELEQRRRVSTR